MRLTTEKGMAWLNRAVISGKIIPYLVAFMFATMVAAAIAVHFLSPKSFTSWGNEFWWAAQTVTTVGYGDVVPHTAWGRVVGSGVIAFGVTFISFLTAVVTSYFISALQERATLEERKLRVAEEEETRALLRRLEKHLEEIEDKLDRQFGS